MLRFITRYEIWVLGVLGLLSGAIYVMNLRVGEVAVRLGIVDAAPAAIVSYLIQLVPLGLIYLLAVRLTLRTQGSKGTLAAILLFALLFRLPLIPLDPALSSDVYRYLWEGRVQLAAGVNPYVVPPEDARLAALRDEAIYPHINRKWAPTVYPAGGQLLFALVHRAGAESPQAFKAIALLADALTLLLLLLILQQLHLPRDRIVVYAWNPLLIHEFFWSGHLESFVLPPLLGFLYLFLRRRNLAAGVSLGIATSIKLVPIFLLATVPAGKRLKTAVPFTLVVALAYLFYVDAGTKILGFLPTYFSDPYELFNLGLLQLGLLSLAHFFSLSAAWVRSILFALLVVVLLAIACRPTTAPRDIIGRSYAVVSTYLLLIYPALHPWYLCYLVPLLCFVPSPAWILFSLLLPLSYLKYLTADGTMPVWITFAQFAPLYLLLFWEHWRLPFEAGGQRRRAAAAAAGSTEAARSMQRHNAAARIS